MKARSQLGFCIPALNALLFCAVLFAVSLSRAEVPDPAIDGARTMVRTMVDLVKKARSVRSMLKFVRPMMMDDDRFVQQGIGWFLREAWKRQPEPVESLLLKYKDTAPRKIYQYATEKMTKEQRAKYRRARKSAPKKARS